MEGKPWFFQKQLVMFNRLTKPMTRSKVRLVLSTFWAKVGLYPPECDREELMQAINSTFGRVLSLKTKGVFSRMRVTVDVRKPLRQGIFMLTDSKLKCWVPLKYENLPNFYFGCGRLGHNLKDCREVSDEVKALLEDEYPFSIALKA